MKLQIKEAYPLEGALYEVYGEEPIVTFNCRVAAISKAGQRFVHNDFFSKGHCVDEEGIIRCACSRRDAEKFAAKVEARGVIDTDYWTLLEPEPTLEQKLAQEYWREQQEQGLCA